MARHLITSALPYINGIKHLGNLVGSQLPADRAGLSGLCRAGSGKPPDPIRNAVAVRGQMVQEYARAGWTWRPEFHIFFVYEYGGSACALLLFGYC